MPVSTTTAATERPPVHDHDDDARTPRGIAADAGRDVGATFDTVRTAVGDVGERMPDLARTVRTGATDGARMIRAWPEPTQRLLAAFSLGLGVGLMVAGAPRLLVGGALLPALSVAASTVGRESNGSRTPA
jgi:hypothetical protein